MIVAVQGVPDGVPAAFRLSDGARAKLGAKLAPLTSPTGRAAMIAEWARSRERVSSTEVADLADVSTTHAGTLLTDMEANGVLRPSRASKRGRGFFYFPTSG